MVKLKIDQKPLVMELDTVASVSPISEETWKQVFLMMPLDSSRVKLNTYSV